MIYFITTNKGKFNYANSFFGSELNIVRLNKKTPEIQSQRNRKISEYSALWAANKYNVTVIKEDTGLYIKSLNGFPGPYLSDIEKQIKVKGFLNLLSTKKDRSAYWSYSIAYCEPNSKPISFTVRQYGTISKLPMGKSGYVSDKIFIPNNENKTISQLLDVNEYKRKTEHYQMLINYLKK